MSFYRRNRKEFLFILLFTLLKLAIHFTANSNFGYHRDEFLYKALGEHPGWGYKEVPPFIAGVSWLTSNLFGDSVFAARLLSTLCGALIVYLTGLTVLAAGGKRFAISIACLAVIISPAFLASGYLLQPVVFDQFFWVLSAYLLIRHIRTRQNRFLYFLGIAAGFGMLNKYSLAFYLLALFIGLLLTPQRRILLNKAWLATLAIAFIIFLPNLLWQISYDLPVIRHMKELRETQLNFIDPIDFILQQLLVHATASIIWICGLVYLFTSRPLKPFRCFGYAYFAVILLLILLQGKSYYSFGAYPVLFAFGGMALSRFLFRFQKGWKYTVVAALLVPSAVFLPIAVPILPFDTTLKFFRFTADKLQIRFPLKWEDLQFHATTQDYADMLGWEEIAVAASRAFERIPQHERGSATLFASNYGQAGALDHYRKKYRLPETVCLNSSYALWSPDSIRTQHFIYVDDEYPDDLQPLFREMVKIGEVQNPYAREKGTDVYLFSYPVKDLNPVYKAHRREALE
ncbi:glycosyltransferase family 39 protein [Flavihumibacter sp. R14]|nr:glycosyltransferase family 39 protein [Flavihumibacter soli]